MEKEDFIRKHDDACCYYFDGYYSSCIEEFLGEIYDDFEAEIKAKEERIKELEEAMNLTRREWYQKGFNEAMKPKTCEGCKYKPNDGECYYEPCGTCARFFYDHYEPKEIK